ncbi:carboxypeptidase-like regulatory domain-containing protein [Paraflavitalea speifideaquila]|uniref:carboxypeptidase-like regulatory domain-containing protein n=1 Tax=Paraflavitalea speifideaquila TaxID=3076558 RepID=UPI0028EBCABA|nr:carboxypeptidase-like regulatory domain-containing protein [Paraflavitalea speifideiaquila]
MRRFLPMGIPLKLLCCSLFTFLSLSLIAQQPVSGTVRSGDAPVAGVTVTIKGTQTATLTNEQGKFTINATTDATLVFSHVNYTSKEALVAGVGALDIQLDLLSNSLGEVVIVGYNAQKKPPLLVPFPW